MKRPYPSHLMLTVVLSAGLQIMLAMIGGRAIAQSSKTLDNSDATATEAPLTHNADPIDLSSIDPSDYEEYPDFERLQHALEQANFLVRLELPPKIGNYGLLDLTSRTVWVNPVVFELGIAEHTLVHEAVHAAQLCGSYDEFSPLGLELEPPLVVRPYFMRYSGIRRLVEAEAYTVQALDNRVEYVIDLLNTYCD